MVGRNIIFLDFVIIVAILVVVIITAITVIGFTRGKFGCVGISLID